MPFGGLAAATALGLASSLPKLKAAYDQSRAADKLKLQDTRPAAFLEKMGLARQAAASGRLPGQAAQQARLGMVQAGALQNARLGAASSGDFLASASAADARRQQGEQQLGVQGQQYNDQAQQRLGSVLDQDANYRTKDRDTFNRTKAALTQSSAENLDNGVGTIAAYGAQGLNMGLGLGAGMQQAKDAEIGEETLEPRVPALTGGVPPLPEPSYQPGQVMGLRRGRYNLGVANAPYPKLGL